MSLPFMTNRYMSRKVTDSRYGTGRPLSYAAMGLACWGISHDTLSPLYFSPSLFPYFL